GSVGDDPGGFLSRNRQASVQDGAGASPFRAQGLGGAEDHRSILDRLHPLRRGGAALAQAALTHGARVSRQEGRRLRDRQERRRGGALAHSRGGARQRGRRSGGGGGGRGPGGL